MLKALLSKGGSMSNSVNDQWLERAAEMASYFESTVRGDLLQRAIDEKDWDEITKRTIDAEAECARQDYYGNGQYA